MLFNERKLTPIMKIFMHCQMFFIFFSRSDGCNKDIPSDFEEKSFQNYLEDFRTSPFTGERNNFDSDQRNENDRNFEEGSSLREYRDEDYNGVDTMESSIVVLLSVITCSIVNAISSWRKDL